MILVYRNSFTQCSFSGVALDSADGKDISIIKKQGKVKALEEEIFCRKCRPAKDFRLAGPLGVFLARRARAIRFCRRCCVALKRKKRPVISRIGLLCKINDVYSQVPISTLSWKLNTTSASLTRDGRPTVFHRR